MVQGVLFERDYHRHIIHGASLLASHPACSISILLLWILLEMCKHMVPPPMNGGKPRQSGTLVQKVIWLASSFKANLWCAFILQTFYSPATLKCAAVTRKSAHAQPKTETFIVSPGTCTTEWKVKSKKCLVSAVNCAPYAYELSALTCDQLSDATEEAARSDLVLGEYFDFRL